MEPTSTEPREESTGRSGCLVSAGSTNAQATPWVAYLSRCVYPDPTAAAAQMVRMAGGFAEAGAETHFFAHDLRIPVEELRERYGVGSPAPSVHVSGLGQPRGILSTGLRRAMAFNLDVARRIMGPGGPGDRPAVLFTRSRLERLFWGTLRPVLWPLRTWTFACEFHDDVAQLLGLSDEAVQGEPPRHPERRFRLNLGALERFDLVYCPTEAAAADVARLSGGRVRPRVLRHASGLPRASAPWQEPVGEDGLVLLYCGTVDRERGVRELVQALRRLPGDVALRLVGRVADDSRGWLEDARVELGDRIQVAGQVPYPEVREAMSRADVLLLPAGEGLHVERYALPLKLTDYMTGGRPIVAADVPSHRELLEHDRDALLYARGEGAALARCILELKEDRAQARRLARAAWERAADFTYLERARRILADVRAEAART